MVAHDLSDLLQRAQHPGGGLRMDDPDRLDLALGRQGLLHDLRQDRLAPWDIDALHVRPTARGDLHHAPAKEAVDDDDDAIPGLHHIAERRFHARGAGRRQRQCPVVRRAEYEAQHVAHLVQHRPKIGVEMAQHRRQHRLQDAGMHIAGARPQQNPIRQFQFVEIGAHVRMDLL